jgi:hypothetical protein
LQNALQLIVDPRIFDNTGNIAHALVWAQLLSDTGPLSLPGEHRMLHNRGSRIISALSFIVSFAILGAQVCPGQQLHTVFLGAGRVNGGLDHDTIQAGQQGTFRAIQLRVSGGAVNFLRIVVQYGNGTRSEIPVRSNIPSGGATRMIDLPGDRRIIQRVDFWYSKTNWATLPKVSLYGVR